MSYIGYLNRQQKMIERGVLVDDFEDEEEGQSEDESQVSNENEKSKTATKTPVGGKDQSSTPMSKNQLLSNTVGANLPGL